jgi:hypothetical protein
MTADLPQPGCSLVSLSRTCCACPSQWEGETDDGREIYIRYRHGSLSWGIGDTLDAAVDASMDNRHQITEEDDGWMTCATMFELLGLNVPAGYVNDGWGASA